MTMYKALKTFTGKVSMHANEFLEIEDKEVAEDLVRSGYIVEVEIPEKIDLSGKPLE